MYQTFSTLRIPGSSHYLYLIFCDRDAVVIYIFVYEETQVTEMMYDGLGQFLRRD